MENTRRVTFFDEDGVVWAHLLLNDSQIRLLDYLSQNGSLTDKYIAETGNTEWKEI